MRTPARLLTPLVTALALVAGCATDDGPRPTGDPVTQEEADLLAGLLARNHDEGGADFVATAPYGDEAVLTLTGAVDFRDGVGRAQVVTGDGSAPERTVWFTREAVWFDDPTGSGSGGYLRRPLLPADDPAPPLLDVVAGLLLNLSAGSADDAAAFLDGAATWQGRRSVDGRLTALYAVPGDAVVAVSATDDVLVQFAAPVPAEGGDPVEVTVTLAGHGRRSLDLPAEAETIEAADHPELGAALGL
ncbi:hypothetical protein [Blastococcus sp. TF02A-30]|uniref:hypothetical protein n=1 Tax=Blastococcus sp. TF02A-30 TaxID=2250580 RepID=UPI000DFC9339|nr:hypothetical protein [Blastococcus sp. TF02A-30]RBY92662.1 hypothetical protein DQ241_00860 [Blastococcus sp. TF02A-30]